MTKSSSQKNPERGSASTKLLVFVAIVGGIANALINYIPVAYNGESFKQELRTAVVQTTLLPPSAGNPVDNLKKKLKMVAAKNQVPGNAVMDVKVNNNVITVHASYSQEVPLVPFGIYNYVYNFDETVTPTGFNTKAD